MKKLYRKGAIHPTPPVAYDHLLSFLPAAILTLTFALSMEERQVLAYLIYCSSANFSDNPNKKSADHPPCFDCCCFRCYISYWVKWDSSPNRQLIHEIIDAFEDGQVKETRKEKNKRERRKGKVKRNVIIELDESKNMSGEKDINFTADGTAGAVETGAAAAEEEEEEEEEEMEKGSVRRFASFLGERFWSVWG